MNYREIRQKMIVFVNTIETMQPSRELSATKTSLQLTQMWLGTYMKFAKLGDNPYAKHDGNRKSVKDIEPLFDDTNIVWSKNVDTEEGLIYCIDGLRQELQLFIDDLVTEVQKENFIPESQEQEMHCGIAIVNIYKNLTEARMWLGMALGAIRNKSLKNS